MNNELEKMVDDLCDTHGDSRVIAINGRIMEMLESAYKMGYGDASCKHREKSEMNIESVVRKVVIIINGVEHVRSETDWTESIFSAQGSGVEFESDVDVIEWIETD